MVAGIIYFFNTLSRTQIDIYSTTTANVFLFLIIIGFIIAGMKKKINVYDAFVEGAKEGFSTAVRIIPYLVAILVAIGVFRASGAMDYLIDGIEGAVKLCGINSDFVGGLPTALMKPFGSVGIVKTRHAVPCGLLADLAGVIAAIFICYLFFG